uniref:Mitochondrial ribosomal protein S18C n=1 Tax=Ditylenchus dipsaci TaxID=166011 RepID=A0A915DTD5_9BILA
MVAALPLQLRLYCTTTNMTDEDIKKSIEMTDEDVQKSIKMADEDYPVNLRFNPYKKEDRKCILCRHQVKLDYKNTRLLQQFVSSFSGRDQHITGLCSQQHSILMKTVAISRRAGYMPVMVKDPKFLRDPKLFDPLKPIRPHSFA